MSYPLSSDLNPIAATATVPANLSAFTPNAMFARATHKQHGLFMASTSAELNSPDAASKVLMSGTTSTLSAAATNSNSNTVVVDRETLAQVQHFHQQQTQQLQHQVAVQQQTILQFQQQQQRQQQEQQHLYATFQQPQQPQMTSVMQPFPNATMAAPVNNYPPPPPPMATPLHMTSRMNGPASMYQTNAAYSSFPTPINSNQFATVNQNFNTNINMAPNPNMTMTTASYNNNGMLIQQPNSTTYAPSTPTYGLPMATPMATMVPTQGADLNVNTGYPLATTARPTGVSPSPSSVPSLPNSQFRLLQSIQLQQELDQQRFGQHTWISSLFHDREGKPLKQPSSLLPPPLCTPSHPSTQQQAMTPSTPVAAIPAFAVSNPVVINNIPLAAVVAAPTQLATITAATTSSSGSSAVAAAAAVPVAPVSSPALSSTAADYDHSNSLLALTMVAHQDEELSASTASSTPKHSNRKRKAEGSNKHSSEEAAMLSSLANDANDSSDASRSVTREAKRKKTSNKSAQSAASKNVASSAQSKQPVQTKAFSFSKANLQLHAKSLAKASEPIVQYHPNSHHVANRSKKKKKGGDDDEEDDDGDEEGATPSSRSRYCLPCPLILTLPKVPLQTLYLQVQRQYTISKKEMEARKMNQSQREELVCVPVRIMGSPSDLSQLYFVAKDVCLLIFIRKGNVAKQIGQFATHEKARLPVLCPRSNGTSSTHVLTALSLAGLKRLLGGSKSPLAPHVLKFLLNHLKSLSTLVKENKSDPKLAQSFHATLTKNSKGKKGAGAAAQQEEVEEESEDDVVTPAVEPEEAADEEAEEEEEEGDEEDAEDEEEDSYSSEAIALPPSTGPAFPLMSQLPAPGVPLRGKGKGAHKSAPKIVATITPQSITIVGSGELATKIVMD